MIVELPIRWATLRMAFIVAHGLAATSGRRHRVIREDGSDQDGTYHFRILPADECSCIHWTENVGPGLELPCAEQHHSCPVHPLETYGNVPVSEPCS